MSALDRLEAWPAHGTETLPWRQQSRGGSREDRMLRAVDASIPPFIASRDYLPSLETLAMCEEAIIAVAATDAAAAGHSTALSRFLIRTESVASSKIERIQASSEDFARALTGSRANTSATSMVAASLALRGLVDDVGARGRFTVEDLLAAHRALMRDDPSEAAYAGRVRDMQNWVGGSDHSPRNALYVPPDPGRLDGLVDDLVRYLDRDDVPALVQASIAHAQFESIHPFTDGNGRIGRALVSAALRRRGVTENAVPPIASGILARRDDYFETLTAYRLGDPEPVIRLFARSALVAAREARTSIARIGELPSRWATDVAARREGAMARLLTALFDHPVMTAAEMERFSGVGAAQAYVLAGRLEDAGIVHEITGRKRDRVWVASDLLGELDDLDARIQAGMRGR
jgi:Fic family protein